MRVAATIAYDGTDYFGSQVQSETKQTIFGIFEAALSSLGIEFRVVASGRTDRGVHATGQVCHFDAPPHWNDLKRLKRALNHKLPSAIHVRSLKWVDEEFHARYSAKKRTYRYILKVGESNPFEAPYVSFVSSLDLQVLQEKMQLFIGEHDFVHFMKQGSQIQSSVRTIYSAFAYKHKGYVILHFSANGFLRSQIRLMVGALLALDKNSIKEQLEGSKIHKIKPATSNGLYLAKIKY